MEINDTIEFIQNVYDSYNISHSVLVYDKDEILRSDIEDIFEKLVNNDYPVHELTTIPEDIHYYENKYRMFVIDSKTFQDFVIKKENNLSNISVMFCLSSSLLHNICKYLKESKVKTLDSMHLFSC
jgi:hypothetical protein